MERPGGKFKFGYCIQTNQEVAEAQGAEILDGRKSGYSNKINAGRRGEVARGNLDNIETT